MKTNLILITQILLISFLVVPPSAYAQWTWQNPKPQGNDLRSIHYVDSMHVWSVGLFGTIMISRDNGNTWEIQTSSTQENLYSVFFIDSITGWTVGDAGTIMKTTDGGNSWIKKNSGTSQILYDVTFVNNTTGWAVGYNEIILFTNNGGNTWSTQNPGTSGALYSVSFSNTMSGWAVGFGGKILSTSDGGVTWATQTSNTTEPLWSVQFITSAMGWASGGNFQGTLLRTTNGGSTWIAQTNLNTLRVYDIKFINNMQGWAVGNGGKILKSTDGGINWSLQVTNFSNDLHSVVFENNNNGIVVGKFGTIAKTQTGGSSWTSVSNNSINYNFESVWFSDENNGWVTGWFGSIYRTTNGGKTWTLQQTNSSLAYMSIFFLDSNKGWVCGTNGTIKYTNNGGLNWDTTTTGTTAQIQSLRFIDASNGIAVGIGGVILRSTNGGLTWTKPPSPTTNQLYAVHYKSADTVIAVGFSGTILKSTDGGNIWSPLTSPTANHLFSIHFLNSKKGIISGSNGTILKTEDGGTTWTVINSNTLINLYSVSFKNEKSGLAVGGNMGTKSIILESFDGGNSWDTILPPTTKTFKSIFFLKNKSGWLVGSEGIIIKTDSTLASDTKPISSPNDSLVFKGMGVYLLFDSLKTKLPLSAEITISQHRKEIEHTAYQDTIATLFNNSFWSISSNIDTFSANVCFSYDSNQLNTSFINRLSSVYQETQGKPWQLIKSIPKIANNKICFTTDHWSNWAIAITKPEEKIKIDTSFNNTGMSKLNINKSFGEGLSLDFDLMPGGADSMRYTKYDINPGGDLPAGVQKFMDGFWELKGSIDTVALYFDPSNINGYQLQDTGKYRILYRPDAFTDWVEVPTYRVKKALKEKLYIKQNTSSTGDYMLGLTSTSLPAFSVTASVESGCAGDTIRFTSTISGGTAPYQYKWEGDGGLSTSTLTTTYIYPSMGEYKYSFLVQDSTGAIADYSGLIKIDCTTDLDELLNGQINVFPNPMNQSDLTIVFKNQKEGNLKITLYDVYGKRIYQKFSSTHQLINHSTYQLILPHLSQGMYLLQCEAEGKLWMKRLVKL